MQKSQELFEERARRKNIWAREVEMEREGEGETRGRSWDDLCSFVDDTKQNEGRDEGEEGRQTEQEGGLRKQLVRMIQRRAKRGEEERGERGEKEGGRGK